MTADDRTALALAAMRITKGNPTAQDVAALAVLLASRLRHEAQAPQAEGRVEKLPLRPRPSFTAPGAWAS
ncbi:acyl-CoA carboxylase epsilon subunit [Streptomyces sp. KS 21]|uniref:acyl-CoA carboxylase epsilon subunit n=1 Tax=Streptomyces sp. KS 21 TaxID=2485150 RepID=UPI0010626341|nr:acyl-CoA carboxylase epsilon subunit [Streptomyces sp. KS 21]TDU69116.1 acyl-CoA carboxylase epsilon subunit-like protein [Streptomyces sp. KS 21]